MTELEQEILFFLYKTVVIFNSNSDNPGQVVSEYLTTNPVGCFNHLSSAENKANELNKAYNESLIEQKTQNN